MALSGCGCDASSHGRATLGALDSLGCDGWGDVVGFVLGWSSAEEAAEVSLDLGAVGSGLSQECEYLVVIVTGGALAEACAAHGGGGVDAGVDGKARGCDVASRLVVAARRRRRTR